MDAQARTISSRLTVPLVGQLERPGRTRGRQGPPPPPPPSKGDARGRLASPAPIQLPDGNICARPKAGCRACVCLLAQGPLCPIAESRAMGLLTQPGRADVSQSSCGTLSRPLTHTPITRKDGELGGAIYEFGCGICGTCQPTTTTP